MSDEAPGGPHGDGASSKGNPERDGLENGLGELRRLLLGSDVELIHDISDRLADPRRHAEAVADVLPEAIRIRGERDEQMSHALAPSIEETLQLAVRDNPRKMVETLSPVMLPATGKAAVDGIKGVFEKIRPRRGRFTGLLMLSIMVVILVALWWGFVSPYFENSAWEQYVEELRAAEGIMIVSTHRDGGRFHIAGFRDPLADVDPYELLHARDDIAADRVVSRWEPYHSLERSFVERRARKILDPPASVELTVAGGVLRVSGQATAGWASRVRSVWPALPGITGLDDSRLEERKLP